MLSVCYLKVLLIYYSRLGNKTQKHNNLVDKKLLYISTCKLDVNLMSVVEMVYSIGEKSYFQNGEINGGNSNQIYLQIC
jgi:hypothetical protein